MRLTTSLLRWGKISWSCCAGYTFISYWFDNLGFFLRENLLLNSSYLPLGVSQRMCDLHISSTFSGAVAGDLRAQLIQQISSPINNTFSGAVARDFEAPLLRDFNSCNNTFSDTVAIHFSRRHSHQAATSGVSHFQPFYFVIVLLSLLLLCVDCFVYQKSKKISY